MSLTPREYSALASTVLIAIGTAWYIYQTVYGSKVKPVLASWIVLAGTMTLSYATYWTTPKPSLVANACNGVSVLSTIGALGAAYWYSKRAGKSVQFSPFQVRCLQAAAIIATLWIILVWGLSKSGLMPNVLTQVLMIVGYLVTAEKLWHAKENTESVLTWSAIALASGIAIYTAWVSADPLAGLYSVRAFVAATTIVLLMWRIELRKTT